MLFTFVTLPSPTDLFDDIGAWADPFFQNLSPFVYYAAGIILATFLAGFLIHVLKGLGKHHS